MSDLRCAVVIVAGGSGARAGGGVPKQFRMLAGRPLVRWSAEHFAAQPETAQLVVVVPESSLPLARTLLAGVSCLIVAGGARRQDSVRAGMEVADASLDLIAVHDGARPQPPPNLADLLAAAVRNGAAATAVPVTDAIKRAPAGRIESAVPREGLWAMQTPQAARRELLLRALDAADASGRTVADDAEALELAGIPIALVPGSARNRKITTEEDFTLMEPVLSASPQGDAAQAAPAFRVGYGYDVHRLAAGRPLILGGLCLAEERGLEGHSDADALLHAVTDALLGALALGDIGQHFPNTEEQWRGCASSTFIDHAAALVGQHGYRIGNIDAMILAEWPRLAPHVVPMRQRIADLCGIRADCVSIKATTNEGMGFVGREEGIAVHCTALLIRR